MQHDSSLIRPQPKPEQVRAWVKARRDDIGYMSADSPEDLDLDELATMWHQLDTLTKDLAIWVRDLALELGHRLEDMPDGYSHPGIGVLEARRPHQNVKWDGAAVLAGLSQPVVDGNGERIDAVPLTTLRAVIPGVNGTSSRWNVTGLPDRLRKYRDVTYGATLPQIRR